MTHLAMAATLARCNARCGQSAFDPILLPAYRVIAGRLMRN